MANKQWGSHNQELYYQILKRVIEEFHLAVRDRNFLPLILSIHEQTDGLITLINYINCLPLGNRRCVRSKTFSDLPQSCMRSMREAKWSLPPAVFASVARTSLLSSMLARNQNCEQPHTK